MSTATNNDPLALLATLESAVHARRHQDAFHAAIALLGTLGSDALFRDLSPAGYRGNPYVPHAAFCERFAAAWSLLLLDGGVDMARMPLGPLLRNLLPLHLLVHGTAEGTLDVAIRVLNERTGGQHGGPSLARLALLWVPGSRLGIDLFSLYASLPQVITAQAVATVASLVACTPEAHAAREKAIAFLASGRAQVDDYAVLGVSNDLTAAWMRCSYAPSRAGHDVKPFLNRVVMRCEAAPALPAPSPAPAADGKPVLLVPLDSFHSAHAMYRCYAPVIAACRSRFHCVALAHAGALDDTARQLFDEVLDADRAVAAPGEKGHAAVARLALSCRPALVFYPSVGMHRLTLALSLYRLAPVQAMTLGHPATSRSPQMDVLLMEEQWVVDPARYSERVVTLPRGTLRFVLPAGQPAHTRRARNDDVVRIAVPSICQKWTQPFLQALQRVDERVGARAEFHFFSGIPGIGYPAMVNAVQRLLPRAIVHPSLSYADYCALLSRCDVHAGTFPFGGTNSIIDSLVHGLPVLCMAPEDARGAQDADFVGRVGLPDWLVARDVDAWVDALVRIVDEPGVLASLQAVLAGRERVESVFLGGGQPEVFAAALHALVPPVPAREGP